MNRYLRPLHALTVLFALLAFVSCSETDDEVDEYADWQSKNEQFVTNKYNMVRQQIAAGNTDWKIFKSYAKPADDTGVASDYILVKVLNEGTGSGCPLFTDTVRVHYRGQLLASPSYVDDSDPELGLVFDKSWSTDTYNPGISMPSKFGVASVVDGFATAVQHMHIGDRWLVYMPYQLGYGTQDYNNIPAYSTLVFDITLAAYYKPGMAVPDWKADESIIWDVE